MSAQSIRSPRLLEGRNAIIYGGGGAIGGAVARTFAREGANVFLAGRRLDQLAAVAADITAASGSAETAEVDALDEAAIAEHVRAVATQAGSIDISFNAITLGDVQGMPLIEMPAEDFVRPITTGALTHFLTSRAAAPRMVNQRSGVILTLTASAARAAGPMMGGFGVACAAIEAFTRCLAAEVGPLGVRVVGLRSEGIPETWPEEFVSHGFDTPEDRHEGSPGMDRPAFERHLAAQTMLRRMPTLAQVAEVAAFLASDRAGAMTATIANVTCGTVLD